ncbi:flippase [Stenotrophomonas sp. PS02298]|uniref:flippase n=1 Tax=Stenotrophomonas sp. PS02298 TaxID=2991424 RepID=UPI00249C0373|nr:flippase [Stenotrophomonas sp. PS02298]
MVKLFEGAGVLRRGLHQGPERGSVLRSVLATTLIRLASIFLSFVASLVMARVLGVADYGIYSYVMAIAALLGVAVALGFPQYLVREASARPEWVLGLWRWADRGVMLAGVGGAALMLLLAWREDSARRGMALALAAVIPMLTALSEVRRGLLQASGLVVRSQAALLLIAPLFMLTGVCWLWQVGSVVDVWQVMLLGVAACAVSLVVTSVLLRRSVRGTEPVDIGDSRVLKVATSIRFMWLGALYMLLSRTDLIMLGLLSNDEDAGVYAVASRAADLVPLLLMAANIVMAPRIASLYRDGELSRLQEFLTSMMRVVVLCSLPLALFLFIGANWLLRFFYGDAYLDGVPVLRLLVVAQFVLVLGGPLGTMLEMTGNEKSSLAVMTWVVLLNVVSNAVLIPPLGASGAAFATCISVVLGRLLLLRKVRALLSVRVTALGF